MTNYFPQVLKKYNNWKIDDYETYQKFEADVPKMIAKADEATMVKLSRLVWFVSKHANIHTDRISYCTRVIKNWFYTQKLHTVEAVLQKMCDTFKGFLRNLGLIKKISPSREELAKESADRINLKFKKDQERQRVEKLLAEGYSQQYIDELLKQELQDNQDYRQDKNHDFITFEDEGKLAESALGYYDWMDDLETYGLAPDDAI